MKRIVLEDSRTYPGDWANPKVVEYFTKGDSDYVVVQHSNDKVHTLRHVNEDEWEVVNSSKNELVNSTSPEVKDYKLQSVKSVNGNSIGESSTTLIGIFTKGTGQYPLWHEGNYQYRLTTRQQASGGFTTIKVFNDASLEEVSAQLLKAGYVPRKEVVTEKGKLPRTGKNAEKFKAFGAKLKEIRGKLTEYGATSSTASGTPAATTNTSNQPAEKSTSVGQTQNPAASTATKTAPKVSTVDTANDPADQSSQEVGKILIDKLGKGINDPTVSKELGAVLAKLK